MASDKYEYKFITEPSEKLKCLICFEVARDPKQHEDCGKMYCSECIEKNGNKPCPNCRAKTPIYFKDKRGYQEIQELHVKCVNVLRGCKWNGTVGMLDDHVATCKFAFVPCPNKCKVASGEDLQLMRKDVDDHVMTQCLNRDHECECCGEKGTYATIMGEHDKVCRKKLVPCPNTECTLTMERCKMKEHVETICEYGEVACKFTSIGCSTTKMRKDMKQHEENDDNAHLHLALENIVTINKTVSTHKRKTLKDGESLVFKLPGFSSKKRNNERFYSEPFYTSSEGYHMCIVVYANGYAMDQGTHVSVLAKLLEGCYNKKLCWPFKGNITFDLLNQLADDNHLRMIAVLSDVRVIAGSEWGYRKFILHSALSYNRSRKTEFLMEDTLYFRMSVNVASHKPWLDCGIQMDPMLKKMIVDDRTLKEKHSVIFKMPSCSIWKAANCVYRSEPFYSHPTGYKMDIQVHASNVGRDTHVSLKSVILEGPNDHKLKWPFMGTLTFELLNQMNDKNHCIKYISSCSAQVGSVCGTATFISYHNPTNGTQYIIGDTLYIRVTVKVDHSRRKPWLDCTLHTK